MEFGVHLPLIDFGGGAVTAAGLRAYTTRARDLGFRTLAANDHLVFAQPWLDGPVALASVVPESGTMRLATTVGLPVVRGPVAFAKALAALDHLSGGRVIAGVGPGSSHADYDLVGIDFDERWRRLDEVVPALRAMWRGDMTFEGRYYSTNGADLQPLPAHDGGPPIWIGSWGSDAGLRRVARLADGWLASAYNTTPGHFAERWAALADLLPDHGKDPRTFPNGLSTMFFCLTTDDTDAEDVFRRRMLAAIRRPEDELRERLLFGPAELVVDKLVALQDAGVQEVLLWPVIDEVHQLELFCEQVRPFFAEAASSS